MKQFSEQTQKIIDQHKADFDATNFVTKLNNAGGYDSYVRSLGGVFTKWIGKTMTCRTHQDLQEIAEYVFGLMSIWGFDYENGQTRRRWGGGSPFYTGSTRGWCNAGTIDSLCGDFKKAKTTNCNFGIDTLLYKAGLFRTGQYCTNFKSECRSGKLKFTRRISDLQIGDLVEFFHDPVTDDNPDHWTHWGHVCIVGDIVKGKIILFDAGGRFVTTGKYKHEFTVNSKNRPQGTYDSYAGWVGVKFFTLTDLRNTDLAVETIHGRFGSGQTRIDRLGDRYDIVQDLVNHFLTENHRSEYILACALFVLAGHAGNGDRRMRYFGSDYDEVQDRVNRLITDPVQTEEQVALGVINGLWGSGEVRKHRLIEAGYDYIRIQNVVNALLS